MSQTKTARPLPEWTAPWVATARERWMTICIVLVATGLAVVALSVAGWLAPTGTAAHLGSFLALYGVIVALQRTPPDRLSPRLRQRLQATIVRSGVGFYGVMTLARFLQLELHDLLDAAWSFEISRDTFIGLARDWLIGFSAESLRNTIDAFMWPVRLMSAQGMPVAAVLVLAAWSLYALGARVFPEAHAADPASDPAPATASRHEDSRTD